MNGTLEGFLIGSSLILASALAIQLLSRSPLARQRIGEWTSACFFVWAILFFVPLPRWTPEEPALRTVESRQLETALPTRRPAPPMPHELEQLLREIESTPPDPATAPAAAVAHTSTPQEITTSSIDWSAWLLGIWGLGAALASIRLVGCSALLMRRLRRMQRATKLERIFGSRDGLNPRILISRAIDRPFCVGVWRPQIVVPEALLRHGHEQQLRCVMLHELAHLERGDHWRQLGLTLAAPLLWFHPLCYWLRRTTRLAAEVLADHQAVERTDRATYARALLELAESRTQSPTPTLAIAAIGGRSAFYRRMSMLLESHPVTMRSSRVARTLRASGATAITAAFVFAFGTPTLTAQDAKMRDRIKVLEAERAQLRQELADMRAQLARLQKAWANSPATTKFADTNGDGLPDTRVTAVSAPRPLNTAEVADVPDSASEVEADAASVPILSDIPLVSKLFKREAAVAKDAPTDAATPTDSAPAMAVATSRPAPSDNGTIGAHIIDLATRCIDLKRQLRTSELNFERSRKLAEKSLVSQLELQSAEHEVESAKERFMIVRILIDSELRATEQELKTLIAQRKAGLAGVNVEPQISRLEGRLRVLKTVR